jgi:crotonobetainyl-CoA:carnitine CoA-transferase CaiB-like acyl-CoA transferase
MVQDAEDMLNCPQLMGRHMWTEVDRPSGGTFTVPSNPVKIPGVGDTQPRRAPLLGEHTEEVLHDLLGLSEVQMSDMRSAGAV